MNGPEYLCAICGDEAEPCVPTPVTEWRARVHLGNIAEAKRRDGESAAVIRESLELYWVGGRPAVCGGCWNCGAHDPEEA